MLEQRIPLPGSSWRVSQHGLLTREQKCSSKQVPAHAKSWPIGSTQEGGREPGMEKEKQKEAWK